MNFRKSCNQIKTIFFFELKQSFKNWKFILILIICALALFGSLKIVGEFEYFVNKNIDYNRDENSVIVGPFDDYVEEEVVNPRPDVPQTVNMFDELRKEFGSLNILIPLMLGFLLFPLIVFLLGFDLISSERTNNSIRYLLSRTSRLSILLGKFFANAVVLSGTIIIFFIASNIYLKYRINEIIHLKSMILPLIFLIMYSLSLLSLMLFTSSFSKRIWSSILLGILGIVLMLLFLSNSWLAWLSIFHNLSVMLGEISKDKILNLLRLFGLSGLFFFLAWWKLERSDL